MANEKALELIVAAVIVILLAVGTYFLLDNIQLLPEQASLQALRLPGMQKTRLLPMVPAVALEPLVTDVFSFEEYSAAYKKIELEPATTMKVVVEVNK